MFTKKIVYRESYRKTRKCYTCYTNATQKKTGHHSPVSFEITLPHINHIDENTKNNSSDNLEWCTPQYNNYYGTAKFRQMLTMGKPVEQRLVNGQLLAVYVTSTIAEEITGISRKEIAACIRGELRSAGGFIWKRSQCISKSS